MSKKDILSQLTSLIPNLSYFIENSDKAPYETGWRYGKGKALAVLRPRTTEEVATILAYCNEHRIGVVPQGGNTGLVAASTPDLSGDQIVLSTSLLHHKDMVLDKEKGTVTVGAGVVLDQLNEVLAKDKLHFPVDISASGTCQIGGMIATNAAGAKAAYYGTTKTNTLELTVVLADGSIRSVAPQPNHSSIQDNSVIDKDDPFIGSEGWLGVVTKAVLQVQALPNYRATALVSLSHNADIRNVLRHFSQTIQPSAVEFMDNQALILAAKHLSDARYPWEKEEEGSTLLLEYSSAEPLNSWLEEQLIKAYEQNLITNARSDKPHLFWQLRHHISEALAKEAHITALDLSTMPEKLAALRAALHQHMQDYPDITPIVFGHEALGAMHYNLLWHREYDAVLEEALRSHIYDIVVQQYQGSFSAEHNIGPYNQRYYDRYTSEDAKQLASQLKETYDPRRILNPNIHFD